MNEVVIKPPEGMKHGKVFRPSRMFLYKELTMGIVVAVFFWAVVLLSWMGLAYIISIDEGWSYTAYMNALFWPVNFWMWVLNAIWLIPSVIVVPYYIKSIEYSVIGESGEAMPEIYVKKGIINVTRKHVPFRTITNISSRAGPFDRVFGIGNVEIETAGFSGSNQMGPEEKIEGVPFYEELRDYILAELRRFRDPYAVATEMTFPRDEPIPRMDDSLQDEILLTLREIRDLLRKWK
jgi:membrane protein YdbS with pleckstrin-like domain